MKKLVLLMACVALFASCKFQDADDFIKYRSAKVTVTCTGNIEEQTKEIKGAYDEIEVYDDINVVVTNEVSEPTIVADEALMEHIVLMVQEKSLLVAYKSPIKMEGPSSSPIVKLPELGKVNSVELNGESKFYCGTPIEGDYFELSQSGASYAKVDASKVKNTLEVDMSGASEATIVCNAKQLEFEMSGACYADLSGETEHFELNMSGASRLESTLNENVYGFSAKVAEIDLSGSSKVEFNCVEKMEVDASGNTEIKYSGAPVLTQEVSGSASVESIQ